MEKLVKTCLTALRISTKNQSVLDEVESLILSCHKDLKNSGVEKIEFDDPLIIQATRLYVKAYFNTAAKDSERLTASYEMLKISLSLSGDYKHV